LEDAMDRRVALNAAIFAALLCAVSCGGGSGTGADSPAVSTPNTSSSIIPTPSVSTPHTSTPHTSSSTAATSSGNGTPTAKPPGGGGGGGGDGDGDGGGGGGGGGDDDGFAYPPWGPDDPPIPGQYAAFAVRSSQDLQCAAIKEEAPDDTFWGIAVRVCNAIRGDDQAWPEGKTVPSPPAGENGYQGCLNTELAAMLRRAVSWHASNPGRRPEIAYPSKSSTPCQRRLYGVEVLSVSEADDLDLGPGGQTAVRFGVPTGRDDLEPTATVTVDGQRFEAKVDFSETGFVRLAVFVDPAPQKRDATLTVDNGRGTITETVVLPESTPPG
jgi:hypothetical protein